MPRVVFVISRIVSLLCLAVLGLVAVFDAQTERFTAGRVPAQFAERLDPGLAGDYDDVVGVAHNAGDDLGAATKAVAYGADAIEIDVRSSGSELFASHDAAVPLLEDLVFRGPSFRSAWAVAQLRDTVLLHLKDRSARYVERVGAAVSARPVRRTIVQTDDVRTLAAVQRRLPAAERLLLLLDASDVRALRSSPRAFAVIDGVSVRDSLLTAPLMAWLKRRKLATFAWTINEEQRMNELVRRGVDGLITDRLDIMRLLGEGRRAVG